MGPAANKIGPVSVVVMDVPSLDSIGHNMEKIRRSEPELSRYEGNKVFFE